MADKDRFGRSSRYYKAPSGRSAAAQDQFKKSVRKARASGIDTRDKTQQKIKKRNTGLVDDKGGGAKEQFIANQAWRDESDRILRKKMQEQIHQDTINKMRSGTMDKSDFLGYTGGLLGLRTGNFKDNVLRRGQQVYPGTWGGINPETGNLITQLKVREGMTSPQYSQFMRGLFATDPTLFHKTFPAGKILQNVMTKGIGGEKEPFSPHFSDSYVKNLFEGNKKEDVLNKMKEIENFVAAFDPGIAKTIEIQRKDKTPVGELVKDETGMDIFNVEPETTSSRYQENLKKQIDAIKNKTLRENLINQYRSAGGRDVIEDTSFEELWKSPSDRSSYITEERLNEAVQGALDTPPPRVAGEINVETFGPDEFGVNIFGADDDESFDEENDGNW